MIDDPMEIEDGFMCLLKEFSKNAQAIPVSSASMTKRIFLNIFITSQNIKFKICISCYSNIIRIKIIKIQVINRKQQVTIFRLRTGHCRLLGHLYRLEVSHSDECPCGTSTQTPEHVLQSCPLFNDARNETWNEEVDLNEKLWGPIESLRKTTDFITKTGLDI